MHTKAIAQHLAEKVADFSRQAGEPSDHTAP